MIKLIIFILSFWSMKALAGYRCNLSLSHSNSQDDIIVEKTIDATEADMISSSHKFEIEGSKKFNLNFFVSGWAQEEEASFFLSRNQKDRSEEVSLRGNDNTILWYEDYRMEIDCKIK